jgi:lysosomal Pro-X carboxypeptidase
MDYVVFLKFIKQTYCSNCPIVAFGGSYAGMLASWMRIKYPNIIDMAHAASAPIYYFQNRKNFDPEIFYQIVTKNYLIHSVGCSNAIR